MLVKTTIKIGELIINEFENRCKGRSPQVRIDLPIWDQKNKGTTVTSKLYGDLDCKEFLRDLKVNVDELNKESDKSEGYTYILMITAADY